MKKRLKAHTKMQKSSFKKYKVSQVFKQILFLVYLIGVVIIAYRTSIVIANNIPGLLNTSTRARDLAPAARFTIQMDWKSKKLVADASISKDDYKITKYVWRINDGSSLITTEPRFEHTFSQAGNYTIELSVIDDANQSDHSICEITIPLRAEDVRMLKVPKGVKDGVPIYDVEYKLLKPFFNAKYYNSFTNFTSPQVSAGCGSTGSSQYYNNFKNIKNEITTIPLINQQIKTYAQKVALDSILRQSLRAIVELTSLTAVYLVLLKIVFKENKIKTK